MEITVTSNLFALFVLLSVILYYLIPLRMQWMLLLAISILFYASYGLVPLVFLVFSAYITWIIPLYMKEGEEHKRQRRILLAAGVLADLVPLLYLKYAGFFAELMTPLTGRTFVFATLLLPLGISYYTFQTIGYMADAYRGEITPCRNFFQYLLFVCYFPHIIQGPIARYADLMPQLLAERAFSFRRMRAAVLYVAWGLFQMMLVADWASLFRTSIFADTATYGGLAALGAVLYGIELYANFSGGIDLMRGISVFFGVMPALNFRRPYFATSIADFWRRWHITLGTFLRNNIYFPLGGSRKGKVRTACNLLVVFFVSGLWHGASLSFVGWGVYHGILSALAVLFAGAFHKGLEALHIPKESSAWHAVRVVRTFVLVNFGWFFFLADSFENALAYIRLSVTSFTPALLLRIPAGRLGTAYTPYALWTLFASLLLMLLVGIIRERGVPVMNTLTKLPLWAQVALGCALICAIPLFAPMGVPGGFIYAQF